MRDVGKKSAWNLAKYHRTRQAWIERLGGKCIDCGTTEDLQFDHADASSKIIDISRVLTYAAPRVEAEMAKCVLRCKPCHVAKSRANKELGGGQNKVPEDDFVHGTARMYHLKECRCELCRRAKRYYRSHLIKIDEVVPEELSSGVEGDG